MSDPIDFNDLPDGAQTRTSSSGLRMVRLNPDGNPWEPAHDQVPTFVPSSQRARADNPTVTVRQQREAFDRQELERAQRAGQVQPFQSSHERMGGK